jgi:recombination protein RecT
LANELSVFDRAEAIIHETEPRFLELVSDKVLFAKETAFAMQILRKNDYLAKMSVDKPLALRDAIVNIAALGVSLNPAKKQAYLVPRKGIICLDISYMGLLDIAVQSGSILWGQARVVHAKDTFEMTGVDRPPVHKFSPFEKFETRGEIIGAYVVVKTPDGDYLTEAMSLEEIVAIRNRSEAWKAYEKDKTKVNPWVTDFSEMAKKTVIKRAAKTWPHNDKVERAIHHLNTDGQEGLEFAPGDVKEVPGFDMTAWTDKLADATDWRAAEDIKIAGFEVLREIKDPEAYKVFKTKANARIKELFAAEEAMTATQEREPGEEG